MQFFICFGLVQCTGTHKANVNCLEIGHKSGQIMVSGGDDGIVNFWAVGKDQCILVRSLLF